MYFSPHVRHCHFHTFSRLTLKSSCSARPNHTDAWPAHRAQHPTHRTPLLAHSSPGCLCVHQWLVVGPNTAFVNAENSAFAAVQNGQVGTFDDIEFDWLAIITNGGVQYVESSQTFNR